MNLLHLSWSLKLKFASAHTLYTNKSMMGFLWPQASKHNTVDNQVACPMTKRTLDEWKEPAAAAAQSNNNSSFTMISASRAQASAWPWLLFGSSERYLQDPYNNRIRGSLVDESEAKAQRYSNRIYEFLPKAPDVKTPTGCASPHIHYMKSGREREAIKIRALLCIYYIRHRRDKCVDADDETY